MAPSNVAPEPAMPEPILVIGGTTGIGAALARRLRTDARTRFGA